MFFLLALPLQPAVAMRKRWFVLSLVLVGCGGAAAESSPDRFSADQRACDAAIADAQDAWRGYALEKRLAAMRSLSEGALAYEDAATAYLSESSNPGNEARGARMLYARQQAAREAAGLAAAAAERADLAYEDALDGAGSHRELAGRYDALEDAARRALQEADEAAARTRRAAGVDRDVARVALSRAESAKQLAADEVRRAVAAERAAQSLAQGRSPRVQADDSSRDYGRAEELTGRATATCGF